MCVSATRTNNGRVNTTEVQWEKVLWVNKSLWNPGFPPRIIDYLNLERHLSWSTTSCHPLHEASVISIPSRWDPPHKQHSTTTTGNPPWPRPPRRPAWPPRNIPRARLNPAPTASTSRRRPRASSYARPFRTPPRQACTSPSVPTRSP